VLASIDPWAFALALAAGIAIFRFKVEMSGPRGVLRRWHSLYLAGAVA
jgi:hypothetical protein